MLVRTVYLHTKVYISSNNFNEEGVGAVCCVVLHCTGTCTPVVMNVFHMSCHVPNSKCVDVSTPVPGIDFVQQNRKIRFFLGN